MDRPDRLPPFMVKYFFLSIIKRCIPPTIRNQVRGKQKQQTTEQKKMKKQQQRQKKSRQRKISQDDTGDPILTPIKSPIRTIEPFNPDTFNNVVLNNDQRRGLTNVFRAPGTKTYQRSSISPKSSSRYRLKTLIVI